MRAELSLIHPTTEAAPARRLYVGSEVGVLRRVILHRPDLELKRLTPHNKDALLFDDVLWVRWARQEHDAFADALTDRGVEVLYLERLMADVLAAADVRAAVLDRTLGAVDLGPSLTGLVREWLTGIDEVELAGRLIGGITYDELPFRSTALSAAVPALDGFVLAPLPNHLFTRDTSAWIYDGVSINAMAMAARQRESVHYDAIYRHHGLFGQPGHVWSDELGGPARFEGGDVLVLGNGCVLVGMGERTKPAGVERLARALFRAGSARRVIAVDMPSQRSTMHLDTVMTMVDRDAFTIYPDVRRSLWATPCAPRAEESRPNARTSASPRSRMRSTSRPCGCSRPEETATRPSVSSGTTATTCWPWRRAWSSPTNATSIPTRGCAAKGSR